MAAAFSVDLGEIRSWNMSLKCVRKVNRSHSYTLRHINHHKLNNRSLEVSSFNSNWR